MSSVYLIGMPMNAPPPSYDQMQQGQGGYPPPQQGYPTQPGYQPVPGQQPGYPAPPPGAYGQPMQPGQPYATQQVVVSQPGQPGYVVTQQRPPDYMIPSILACCCCFCPTGCIAIYYAMRANSLASEGDMVEATRMANSARTLMIASVVIGICWVILVSILRLTVIVS